MCGDFVLCGHSTLALGQGTQLRKCRQVPSELLLHIPESFGLRVLACRHHEGHKSCNFTFCSLGGLWDCLFGTRKAGGRASHCLQKTRRDEAELAQPKKTVRAKTIMDKPLFSLLPVAFVAVIVGLKLTKTGLAGCCEASLYDPMAAAVDLAAPALF